MGYFLGIDLGASRTVAAVARAGNDAAETVDLGDGEGVASVLHLGEDGALAVGAAARRRALTEPDRAVEGFPARIGDTDPMLLAGEPWAPEELTAWLVRWVVDRVAEREGSPADAVGVARPASWDDPRIALLAAAVAEQDLDVRFLAPEPDDPAGDDAPVDGGAAQVGSACAVAVALREAAGREPPTATTASGRHAVVGGAIAALAGDQGSGAPEPDEHEAASLDAWDVPAPRSHGSGAYGAAGSGAAGSGAAGSDPTGSDPAGSDPAGSDPTGGDPTGSDPAASDPAGSDPDETGRDGPDADEPGTEEPETDEHGGDERGGRAPDGATEGAAPATTNLVAELLGFTGGMGATNTAGLLSGYTPPQGMPAAWSGSGGPVAIAPAETATEITPGTATGRAVALPSQRSSSGRWSPVAPLPADLPATAHALRARNNPTVLVGAGGLAAAVAVVGTLLLWPAPRITNSATSRPIPAVPVAAAPAEPTAAPTVALTPEPTPTRRARPATPRTRRTVVPQATAPESATDTTPPPTGSAEPTEPTTSVPPSTEPTAPTTTTSGND